MSHGSFDPNALPRLEKIGGQDLIRRMIEAFLEQGEERLAAAQEGWKAQNLDTVARAAHPLKSSAAHLGATRLAEVAAAIEHRTREGETESLPDLLGELGEAFGEARDHLLRQKGAI